MTQETIHVFLRSACLRLQLCHYRIQIAFGWNSPLRVEMQSGMVDDRVEFLVGELWGGYAALLKKCFFRPAMFFACCLSMPLPIFAATLAFLPLSGTRRSRASQLWWSRAEPVERNAWDVLPRRCRAKVSPGGRTPQRDNAVRNVLVCAWRAGRTAREPGRPRVRLKGLDSLLTGAATAAHCGRTTAGQRLPEQRPPFLLWGSDSPTCIVTSVHNVSLPNI